MDDKDGELEIFILKRLEKLMPRHFALALVTAIGGFGMLTGMAVLAGSVVGMRQTWSSLLETFMNALEK